MALLGRNLAKLFTFPIAVARPCRWIRRRRWTFSRWNRQSFRGNVLLLWGNERWREGSGGLTIWNTVGRGCIRSRSTHPSELPSNYGDKFEGTNCSENHSTSCSLTDRLDGYLGLTGWRPWRLRQSRNSGWTNIYEATALNNMTHIYSCVYEATFIHLEYTWWRLKLWWNYSYSVIWFDEFQMMNEVDELADLCTVFRESIDGYALL